ncbi:MAG: FtsK/SpoIIIE family DNA translocase, partial [Planctomycetota bacterium]
MTAIVEENNINNKTLFSGLFLIFTGVFLAISLWTADIALAPRDGAGTCLTGLAGCYTAFYSIVSFGIVPSLFGALLVMCWGLHVIRRKSLLASWPQVIGGIVTLTSFCILITCITKMKSDPTEYGGLLGLEIVPPAINFMGYAGVFGAGFIALIAGLTLVLGSHIRTLYRVWLKTSAVLHKVSDFIFRNTSEGISRCKEAAESYREKRAVAREAALIAAENEKEESEEFIDVEESVAVLEPELEEPAEKEDTFKLKVKKQQTKKPPKQKKSKKDGRVLCKLGKYDLPDLNLLEDPDTSDGEHKHTLQKRGEILENTLADFKIDGKVVGIESGPRVTMFEVALAPGIRVERIFALSNNITMSLKAYNVRIVAPIPGKDTVGIEIPNMENKMVFMSEVIDGYDLKKNSMHAPMFLGTDITGDAVIADLAKMPHMLIAGATGSGKSVCINTILMSFLMTKRPDELKLIMIDPKMVELSRFKDIPHLLSPVVTDMKRAAGILEWACVQMDQRYEQMALLGVNNITKFNDLGEKEIMQRIGGQLPEAELETFPKKMPYMVIVVDELADLMLVAGKEVEKSIIRLASKSRAVGIHVILATQRPSVDVITGLIKANMPSRIAFQVASKIDSRTILDSNGAENLLGAGDMLFMPPASSKLIRSQGVFITDTELFAVIDHCRAQGQPDYHEELKGPVIGGIDVKGKEKDRDELFEAAVTAVIENQRGSVSLLQRKFGIGYGRASRIIDQMAEAGVLGAFKEGKARDILIDMEQWVALCNGEGGEEEFESYEEIPEDMESDGEIAGLREDEKPPQDIPWD